MLITEDIRYLNLMRSPAYVFKSEGLTCATWRDWKYRRLVSIKYDQEDKWSDINISSYFFQSDILRIVGLLHKKELKTIESKDISIKVMPRDRIRITKTISNKKTDMITFDRKFFKKDIKVIQALLWKAKEIDLERYPEVTYFE